MIKVIHTKIFDNTKEESQFNGLAEWELHPYYENPNFTNEVIDITTEVVLKDSLVTREQEMQACQDVIKLVGVFNKTKQEGTVAAILSNANMQSAIFALLTGSPKMAKAIIAAVVSASPDLYTTEEITHVNSILDSVITV